MNLFEDTLKYIEERRTKEWIGIPFNLGNFDLAIPYIEPKRYYLLYAQSGTGKSKLAIKKFLIDPYLFSLQTGYKLKIFYFSLEILKEEVMAQVMSYFYYHKYGIKRAKEEFIRDKPGNKLMQELYSLEEYLGKFSESVEVVDELSFPTGILKYVEKYYLENGKIEKISEFNNKYVSNQGEHVIIITDTLNALHQEKQKNKYETIFDYSQKYCKKIFVDKFGASVCNVQQQNKNSETSNFSLMNSKKIEAKTLPDRNALMECTSTFNDANVVLSLYSPFVHNGIDYYPFGDKTGYDISRWQDNFRRIFLEKSRDGISSYEACLYFDGAIADFQPLPDSQEFIKNPKLYDKYLK